MLFFESPERCMLYGTGGPEGLRNLTGFRAGDELNPLVEKLSL
jgi:hypothetical protein